MSSIVLSTGMEELRKQGDQLLEESGIGVSLATQRLFYMMVQNLGPDQDSFDQDTMVRSIRKALINEAAYYLLRPDALKKKQEDEQAAVTATEEEVGQKAG